MEPAAIRHAIYPKDGPRKGRRTVVMAVVETDRFYGGPEEGGWWYDRTYVVGPVMKMRESRALRLAPSLAARFPKEGRSRYSAIGSADSEILICLPEDFTADTGGQRYE